LIHVVDASGSVDAEGELTSPGNGNPILDILDIEMEIEKWISEIIDRNRTQILRDLRQHTIEESLSTALSGIKALPDKIKKAIEITNLNNVDFVKWNEDDILEFTKTLLPIIKPTLILANKMDLPTSEDNLEKITHYFNNRPVAACSAEAELVLRRAEKAGLLDYVPGREKFRIKDDSRLTREQRKALEYVDQRIFAKWMRTGIQQALNIVVFKLLQTNLIYPVSNETRYSNNDGDVLPDVFLMPEGSTPVDLARHLHTRLVDTYVLAIDAKSGTRLPKDYSLRHRDVIKIRTQPRPTR
jgi:ribosome-binding ATPase YchF (GTP1/OBG family)